jgi:hypothetical protein
MFHYQAVCSPRAGYDDLTGGSGLQPHPQQFQWLVLAGTWLALV